MRRIAVLLAPLSLAALALTACGSSSPPAANAAVTVTGAFDKEPTVTIPAARRDHLKASLPPSVKVVERD